MYLMLCECFNRTGSLNKNTQQQQQHADGFFYSQLLTVSMKLVGTDAAHSIRPTSKCHYSWISDSLRFTIRFTFDSAEPYPRPWIQCPTTAYPGRWNIIRYPQREMNSFSSAVMVSFIFKKKENLIGNVHSNARYINHSENVVVAVKLSWLTNKEKIVKWEVIENRGYFSFPQEALMFSTWWVAPSARLSSGPTRLIPLRVYAVEQVSLHALVQDPHVICPLVS